MCLQALSAHGGSLSNDNHQKCLNEHIIKMRLRKDYKATLILNYFDLNPILFDIYLIKIWTHRNASDLFCVIFCDEEWGLMAVSTFEEIIPVISAGN